MSGYEIGDDGVVTTKPVMNWSLSHVAGAALLLTIHYADTPDELERGDSKPITLALSPQLALEIAEALKRNSENMLAGLLPSGVIVH